MRQFWSFLIFFGLAAPVSAAERDGAQRVREYCSHALAGLSALESFYFLGGRPISSTSSRKVLTGQLAFSRPRLEELQKSLQSELARPKHQRVEADPRWFARFRSDATNPVRLRLEAESELAGAKIANARKAEKLLTDLETLSRAPLRASRWDALVLTWLFARAETTGVSVLRKIVPGGRPEELGTIDSCRADAEALAALENDTHRLRAYLRGEGRNSPLVREMFEAAWQHAEAELRSALTPIVGDLQAKTFNDLINLALQTHLSYREVALRYHELDRLAGDPRVEVPLKEDILVILTAVAVTRPSANAAEVFRRFRLIDKITSGTRHGFFLYDPEVVAMVDLTYQHGISAEGLCNRFFEIVNLGRTRNYGGIQNRASVFLTHLSLLVPQTANEVADVLVELREAAEKAGESLLSDNDLALAILIPQAWSKSTLSFPGVEHDWCDPAVAAVEDYRILRISMEAAGQRQLDEEVLSRLVGLGSAYHRYPENIASDWDVVLDLEGRDAAPGRVLTILGLAYSSGRDGDDVFDYTLPPRLNLDTVLDGLREDTARRRRHRRESGR